MATWGPGAMLVIVWTGLMSFQPSRPTSTEALQGRMLFRACQNEAPSETGGEIACVFYFEGFTDGQSSTGKGFCTGRASYGDMIAAYIAYMKQHPKVLMMDREVGIIMALGQAYPCRAK